MSAMTPLVTPLSFSAIQANFYRGSYPREINIPFMGTLGLKYIVSLTPEPLTNDPSMDAFCKAKGIHNIHIECSDEKGAKDKSKSKDKSKEKASTNGSAPEKSTTKVKRKKKPVPIEYDVVIRCIQFLIDKTHYPCYIHCTNGELVTSLVVACLRKLCYWSTVSIFNEYLTYTSSINIYERNFIENFNLEIEIDNLDIKDKVPWITIRANDNFDSGSAANHSKETNMKRIGSFPGKLPRLNFRTGMKS
ncbi:LADA_0A05006g1_1 [Lachancea dasiensis]|uniref:LADA_0A05006g1_1 n=1 Tax=Lachancea dasiensis TaxID=1072105 RepID=A0A1G4INP9_9SACH|nr:LADA_0A05006g1_1 [Lachancea dasiensis]